MSHTILVMFPLNPRRKMKHGGFSQECFTYLKRGAQSDTSSLTLWFDILPRPLRSHWTDHLL